MTGPHDHSPDHPDDPQMGDTPPGAVPEGYAEETAADLASAAPRRSASAEFVVQAEVGSQAALRDAMDPANQSLADALRLSFRVLQLVILVLIVLFLFSGVQTVDEGETGVLTRWGKIMTVGGDEALAPGLQYSLLPYPAGEFVLFKEDNRVANVGTAFWPDLKGQTRERALERAKTSDAMRPGVDGYLLTREGDIAHLRIAAQYNIEDPVTFVRTVPDGDADEFVTLAMQRASLRVVGGMELQEVIDLNDEHKEAIHDAAQRSLDDLGTGIRIVDLTVPEKPSAAFAIEQARQDLQEAIVASERSVEGAARRAEDALNRAAGPAYEQLIDLIEQYEDALEIDERDRAGELLVSINEMLESDLAAGEVSAIIGDARSYGSQVEVSLGAEALRFQTQLENFRRHPQLVVQEAWQSAYQNVLNRPDVESFFVAPGMEMLVKIYRLDRIAEVRRKMGLQRDEARAIDEGLDLMGRRSYIRRGLDKDFDRAGRQLNIGEGGVTGTNQR